MREWMSLIIRELVKPEIGKIAAFWEFGGLINI